MQMYGHLPTAVQLVAVSTVAVTCRQVTRDHVHQEGGNCNRAVEIYREKIQQGKAL